MHRGGRRPRHAPDSVQRWPGRWGPRRLRTSKCVVALAAELVYDGWIQEELPFGPGFKGEVEWAPYGPRDPKWPVRVEVVPNKIWRRGRLFFRCDCGERGTRLFIPEAGLRPRCRTRWGLTYETRSWNYKGTSGRICRGTTAIYREKGKAAARARYEVRRPFLAASLVENASAEVVAPFLQPSPPTSVPQGVVAPSDPMPHEFSWMG